MWNQKTPVTYLLVWSNVLIHLFVSFVVVGHGGSRAGENFMYNWGLVPVLFWDGSWWQPLTALFLHGGLLHLVVNMLALWSLGVPIEATLGSRNFAWLYFISGATGSLFVVVAQSGLTHPTIGASGAVLGLLAALAVFFPSSRLLVFFFPMSARTAAILFGFGSLLLAIYDSSSGISHVGHLGGLVGGVLYSRYVLGLQYGKQQLNGAGRFRPGTGGAFFYRSRAPGPSDSGNDDENSFNRSEREILETMERLRRMSGASGSGRFRWMPSGRVEKEINPGQPRDVSGPEESREAFDSFSVPHPDPGESRSPEGDREKNPELKDESESGSETEKKLYYDPEKGTFYMK